MLPDIDFASLSLEPTDRALESAQVRPTGRARFTIDLRSGKDRRQRGERRQELRFQADRRSGKDRRPVKTWEPGKNL